jgi:hypothetical protein
VQVNLLAAVEVNSFTKVIGKVPTFHNNLILPSRSATIPVRLYAALALTLLVTPVAAAQLSVLAARVVGVTTVGDRPLLVVLSRACNPSDNTIFLLPAVPALLSTT